MFGAFHQPTEGREKHEAIIAFFSEGVNWQFSRQRDASYGLIAK